MEVDATGRKLWQTEKSRRKGCHERLWTWVRTVYFPKPGSLGLGVHPNSP